LGHPGITAFPSITLIILVMSNSPTTPNQSRFTGWTDKDFTDAAALAADDTQDVSLRRYAVACLRDYLKEISSHA
jgi:hypothetical protein